MQFSIKLFKQKDVSFINYNHNILQINNFWAQIGY